MVILLTLISGFGEFYLDLMAAPEFRDPGRINALDLSALIARERLRWAMAIWKRRREEYFRRRIGWEELVVGGGRRVARSEEEEEEDC